MKQNLITSIAGVALLLTFATAAHPSQAAPGGPQPTQAPSTGQPLPAATAVPGESIQQEDQAATTAPEQGPSSRENPSNGAGTMALSPSSYTYRAYWGYKNGWWRLTLYDSRITANSRVFASFSEVNSRNINDRFVGGANYTIHNIAPRLGAVTILVSIEWGVPLPTVIDYLVIQPQ